MKFKDKNGNIFIPSSKFMEEQMLQSGLYTEVKKETKTQGEQEKE